MDQAQNKVDMSLDDIIKLNKKEKRQAKKTKAVSQIRGRGRGKIQVRGRGRGSFGGLNRGMRGKPMVNRRGQRGRPIGRGRGRNNMNNSTSSQLTTKSSMRGVNQSSNIRGARGRGRGRGRALNTQASVQTKNLRGIGRGRGNYLTKRKQLIFTNSSKRPVAPKRTQQLMSVKTQASLLREKEEALRSLQEAKKKMQSINKAIQQTSRDDLVNQRRGLTTNGAQTSGRGRGRGRGRGKLLAGLMNKNLSSSMTSLPSSSSTNRHFVNTSVTINNPTAGRRRRQWRAKKTPDVVVQVDNRTSPAPAKKSFLDKLNMLKPSVPTTYKFQKNMFAVPSTSMSLNDRFSGPQASGDASTVADGRKVYL